MRRKDKEITDMAEIEEIIEKADVCRLAMATGEIPYVIPMSFGYDGGVLYFHSAKDGRKIDILRQNPKVCFEFDIDTSVVEGETACKFGVAYRSVIGFGEAVFLESHDSKGKALEIITRHYTEISLEIE